MSAELLIAPLKALVATLGTGVLPPGATAVYSDTGSALAEASTLSDRSVAATAAGWRGAGGDRAGTASRRLAAVDDSIGTAGSDITSIIEHAAGRVKEANTELNALVESFVATAATVPAIASPAGLAALVPLALSHLARGVHVVQRAQVDLSRDASALEGQAAADPSAARAVSGAPSAGAPSSGGGRIPITLPDGSVSYAENERAATAVRAALSVQGTPYVWGGTTTDGFDCSGFTQWAYRQAGVELPRLAQDQDTAGFAVSQDDLQPGDLAVWSGHVAMYIGNGQLVETGGDPVGVTPLRTSNADQTFEGFYRPR
ncbi:C40 family peptidase [Gordonia sp. LUNF6]|uniref:C40 family peptidase n=2 Tax=Gordoniaceae TaxID=85026 RepID=UPI0007847533|nr:MULTISPECIES: C40 family peptidase [Gordonia]KXT57373.1 hydrolase Nlp/P60 [Gordonia sp. QH-12]WFN93959.1 C40 family peptidase [Gordonia sihwensis]